MALLTPMTLEQAQGIGACYGLRVVELTPVAQGSVNSNFAAELHDGTKVFIRVCEESDHDAVRVQNQLLFHLVAAGVQTPAPLTRTDVDGTVTDHAGKPVAVFPFCQGGWVCQQRVTEAHLQRVGEELATIHSAGEGHAEAPQNRFGREQLHARIADLRRRPLEPSLAVDVDLLAARLTELDERLASHPHHTIVHGDVFRDNVLWHADGRLSAMLDFESAAMGHPAFDLMVALLAWCFGDSLEQPLARALLRGYRGRRQLPQPELDACYDQARAAAVRFAVTRITDYELRPRDVVVYKDYRRFMARLRAVESIGRDDLVGWLGVT